MCVSKYATFKWHLIITHFNLIAEFVRNYRKLSVDLVKFSKKVITYIDTCSNKLRFCGVWYCICTYVHMYCLSYEAIKYIPNNTYLSIYCMASLEYPIHRHNEQCVYWTYVCTTAHKFTKAWPRPYFPFRPFRST